MWKDWGFCSGRSAALRFCPTISLTWRSVTLRSPYMAQTQGGEHRKEEPPEEVYPGAPLRAVAMEARFAPLLDAHARFGAFQRAHAIDFDRLLFADSGDELGPDLDGTYDAILFSKSLARAVGIAPDGLAVVTYDYGSGFTGFMSWALPLLQEGLRALDVPRFTSVRFRYENAISTSATNQQNGVDLAPMFRVLLPRGDGAHAAVRNVHLFWKQMWPTGSVNVALDCCSDLTGPDNADLTITGQCDGSIAASDVEAKIREAHRIARLTFEELITPEYREKLRGRS